MLIMIFITLLEIMVAVIQAYVFCLLITIYLGDTIALHLRRVHTAHSMRIQSGLMRIDLRSH